MPTNPPHIVGIAVEDSSGGQVKVARAGVACTDDLSDPVSERAFGYVVQTWLAPEIDDRHRRGVCEKPLPMWRALIVLPPDGPSRVYLNGDAVVHYEVVTRYPSGQGKTIGDIVVPEDIDDIINVCLPQVTDVDGFLLLTVQQFATYLAFDCLPCHPKPNSGLVLADIRKGIMRTLCSVFVDEVFGRCFGAEPGLEEQLVKDGWWPAQCLLPVVWLKMLDAYRGGEPEKAAAIAAEFATTAMLGRMKAEWMTLPEFKEQEQPIAEGVDCYLRGQYAAAARTLVPCIEGIVARRAKSRGMAIPKHRGIPETVEALAADVSGTNLPSRAFDGFIQHLRDYVLQRFRWSDAKVGEAEGRHADTHGATATYEQGYGLRIILALDSLYRYLRPQTIHTAGPSGQRPPP